MIAYTLSIYFNDPERNGIEVFWDTPWHVAQPQGKVWDTELDEAALLAAKHKLYGRETEIAQLLAAVGQACHGQGAVLLVPGLSGVGKTSLVNVLREPTFAKNGFFLELSTM